jgi:parvulin-like peptidyl-prolyl isomerase
MVRNYLRLLSLVCLLLAMPSLVLAKGSFNDAILAIVNSEVITLKDLKDYLSGVYRQLKIEHRTPQEIQQVMGTYEEKGVNQLIEDRLILEAANKKGIEIRPELIEKRLREIKDRYPTEDDFLKELASQGLTVSDLKKRMTDQLKSKFIIDIEVKDKLLINPEDVTRYYNNHPQEFQSKTKYDLESIYISFDKGKAQAQRRIKEAQSKLSSGVAFEEVRKEFSEAPSVGTLEQGEMVPAVEREVFKLQKGDISPIVEVANGVYIFKVNDISIGGKQSLNDVKDKLYGKIYDQEFQKKYNAWIEKLRNKAYVEIRG